MNKKEKEKDKDAVMHLSAAINGSFSKKKFAQELMHEHRYLQEEIFLLMIECMREWSDSYGRSEFDGRNQFACSKSCEIIDVIEGRI